MKVDRRSFVFSIAAVATAPPHWLLGQAPTEPGRLREAELESLGHFVERLIPTDEFPGAREAGVVNFIDRMLKEAHPDWRVVYRSGLRSLDLGCRRLHGKAFAELAAEQQDEVLRNMERGGLPAIEWFGIPSEEFFAMVRAHCMQGYYGHPKWGGNRSKASWAMIGYDDWWA